MTFPVEIIVATDSKSNPASHSKPADYTELLDVWNDTARGYPRTQCVHHLFEAQVARTPDAAAVVSEQRATSYAELNRMAENLARRLRAEGVGAETPVGLLVGRSVEMLVGMFGILKAGGVYVPMDVGYPRERLTWMVEDAGIRIVVAEKCRQNLLIGYDLNFVHVEDAQAATDAPTREAEAMRRVDADTNPYVPASSARNGAYVIYTSGSTGKPKGVLIEHHSLVNHSAAIIARYGLQTGDRVLQFASISFDVAAEEIFPTLLCGATLVLRAGQGASSVTDFLRFVEEEKLTVVNLPTSYWHEWVSEQARALHADIPSSLRLVVIGSEKALPEKLATWQRLIGNRLRLCNAYGPTETTITATIYEAEGEPQMERTLHSVPIGCPIDNCYTFLLDPELMPVEPGEIGELYIGGDVLARGYLHHPAATSEKFVPNPFAKQPGERLYRTGDMACFLPDGNLEFHGRLDHQVKIRGFRIELGEIEEGLGSHPQVRDAVVVAREETTGAGRLIAYIVCREETLAARELRSFLKGKLPDYMIPAAFVMLEALPLLPNGKVDRLALPAPAPARPELEEAFVAPRTSAEIVVARLWAEVLGFEEVGVNDDFFELGGDSLRATQLVSRIREELQVELPLSRIFDLPTVAGLSRSVEEREISGREINYPPLVPVARNRPLPLTFPQQAVWLLVQMSSESSAYSTQLSVHFSGTLDIGALRRSLSEVVRRHEIFRTTFALVGAMPVQIIHEPWAVELPVFDVGAVPAEQREQEAKRIVHEQCRLSMNPEELPLVRWGLVKLSEQSHILIQVEHHFVHDGWSLALLLREIKQLYEAFAAGKPSPLPETTVQFADFALWQREWMQGEVLENLLSYWRKKLAGIPPLLELPTDRPRPKFLSYRGAVHVEVIPPELIEEVRRFSQQHSVTMFMTMLAVFYTLLSRYSGQNDIALGSSVANRRLKETENLIGMIVNTIVLRADLSGQPEFRELLGIVRRTALEAYHHQDMPFEKLVEELHPQRDPSYNPLFQVMFNFHDSHIPEMNLSGATGKLQYQHNSTTKFDINIIIIPRLTHDDETKSQTAEQGMIMEWEYSTDLFDASTIARMVRHYLNLLRSAVANPAQRISELPLLSEAEEIELVGGRPDADDAPAQTIAAGRQSQPEPAKVFVTASTPTEELLSILWAEALGVERVSCGDNFFESGGDSMSSVKLAARISAAFDVEITLPDFFAAPTVQGLAELVSRLKTEQEETCRLEILKMLAELSDDEIESELGKRV